MFIKEYSNNNKVLYNNNIIIVYFKDSFNLELKGENNINYKTLYN
jgi:hypothetical protein